MACSLARLPLTNLAPLSHSGRFCAILRRMDEERHAPLYWEASYEIVLALRERYPAQDLHELGLAELREMIIALPDFADEPALANEGLLSAILAEWYEESNGA